MTFEGLIRWVQSGWLVAGPAFPALLARHLRLSALNRTSRTHVIRAAPRLVEEHDFRNAANSAPSARGDVVVPVYNNHDDTRDLLEALGRERSFEGKIIIVHDASTDVRLTPLLRNFAAGDQRVLLLENEVNLGFVRTCNRGLAASVGDALILNTDITLPQGAVGRILRRLQSATGIATVTPFSNSAYGVGLPDLVYANTMPFAANVATIDTCLQDLPATSDINLPTGNGFCMGIARAALNEIGAFDERFGHGYGEETDFCMRASARGLRHVLASTVYVGHKGGQSFGGSWQHRSREGLLKVLHRHPEFVARVRDYLENGEARALVFAATLRVAQAQSGRPVAIMCDRGTTDGQSRDLAKPHLQVRRQGARMDAILILGEERYAFKFANDDVFEQGLELAGLKQFRQSR